MHRAGELMGHCREMRRSKPATPRCQEHDRDMNKTYLSLKPSEKVVAQSAATIFAAYISSGLVREGSEDEWMKRAVREAVRIAKLSDAAVTSDDETS